MKILFIGDVVGAPGRRITAQVLPRIIPRWGIDLVVCNAENAAGGSGLTISCHEELADAGVDVFTLGDHAYRKDEVFTLFDRTDRICRAANWPHDSPGAESVLAEGRDGTVVGVFLIQGRTFMKPADCPFRAADRVLERRAGARHRAPLPDGRTPRPNAVLAASRDRRSQIRKLARGHMGWG